MIRRNLRGDDAMLIPDYIAISILIVLALWAVGVLRIHRMHRQRINAGNYVPICNQMQGFASFVKKASSNAAFNPLLVSSPEQFDRSDTE
jgi:hypothetical protein